MAEIRWFAAVGRIGEDGQTLFWRRYYNSNGFATAVVAVVDEWEDGSGGEWACYTGGTDLTQHEKDAVRWLARHGAKMPERDARYFFPELLDMPYRQ